MLPLTLEFTPLRDDFSKAVRTFYQKSNEKFGYILIAIYIPLSLLSAWLAIHGILSNYFIFLFIILSLPPFIAFRGIFSPIRVDEKLMAPTQWIVDDEGLLVKNPSIETKLNWEVFQNAFENREYYFLRHDKNKNFFHFIPKRAFADDSSENLFRDSIKAKLGEIRSISMGTGYRASWIIVGALYLVNIGLLFYSNFHGIVN